MVFTIDGFNIVPFLGEDGVKWTVSGLDSEDAGRVADGLMFRGLIGYKAKCEVSCLWVDKAHIKPLFDAIMPEYVMVVTDTVPWIEGIAVMQMYSNNIGATLLTEYSDGTKVYGDLEFPLVER